MRRIFFASLGVLALAALPAAAQHAPGLPPASHVSGPLHRGPDGKLKQLDPTTVAGKRGACHPGTLCVGPGLQYPTLTAALKLARDGDTIEVMAGTYHETAAIRQDRLTIRGIGGRPHVDCAGLRPSWDKGCLVLAGNDITLENLEISGAVVPNSRGANAACIRNEPNRSFTVRNVVCHDSQDGILTNGGSIVVEGSEFYNNGWTGRTHNVYFSGDCVSVTVRNSVFRDAKVGHEFKSRCRKTTITDSIFRSTRGSRDLDLPDGGEVLISGGTIYKGKQAQNHEIVAFAAESCKHPGSLRMIRVKIVNEEPRASIHNFDKCKGQPISLEGVTFQGVRPEFRGYVIER
jgi:hypothetical protein